MITEKGKKRMDKKILDKIYEAVDEDYLDLTKIEEAVDTEIEPVLEYLHGLGVPFSEYYKAESAVWSAVNIAEQEAFQAGMKFMLEILLNCLT